jgi:hypothetical protein
MAFGKAADLCLPNVWWRAITESNSPRRLRRRVPHAAAFESS